MQRSVVKTAEKRPAPPEARVDPAYSARTRWSTPRTPRLSKVEPTRRRHAIEPWDNRYTDENGSSECHGRLKTASPPRLKVALNLAATARSTRVTAAMCRAAGVPARVLSASCMWQSGTWAGFGYHMGGGGGVETRSTSTRRVVSLDSQFEKPADVDPPLS